MRSSGGVCCIPAAIPLLSPLRSCCYCAVKLLLGMIPNCYRIAIMLLSSCDILMHSCCDYAAITSLRCRVASARPRRIPPKSWNCKWPQVKLRSELTISEQCSENISHSMLLPIKNKDRHTTVFFLFHNVGALYNRLPVPRGASTVESLAWRMD